MWCNLCWKHCLSLNQPTICGHFNGSQTQVTIIRVLFTEPRHSNDCTDEFRHLWDGKHRLIYRTVQIVVLASFFGFARVYFAGVECIEFIGVCCTDWLKMPVLLDCALCTGFVDVLRASTMCHYRVEVIFIRRRRVTCCTRECCVVPRYFSATYTVLCEVVRLCARVISALL